MCSIFSLSTLLLWSHIIIVILPASDGLRISRATTNSVWRISSSPVGCWKAYMIILTVNGLSNRGWTVNSALTLQYLVAPNGIMYVKQKVRVGLLGRMLAELLESRVMVKQAMKGIGDDKVIKSAQPISSWNWKFLDCRHSREFSTLDNWGSNISPMSRMDILVHPTLVGCPPLRLQIVLFKVVARLWRRYTGFVRIYPLQSLICAHTRLCVSLKQLQNGARKLYTEIQIRCLFTSAGKQKIKHFG